MRDRENYRFLRTKAFAMVRNLFRAVDQQLLETGWIEAPGDSLYLEFSALIHPEDAPRYKEIIAANKTRYKSYGAMDRAGRYLQMNGELIPVEKETTVDATSTFKGIGCCSGALTAPVVLIDAMPSAVEDLSGKILVARYFEPGWINLFAQAAGIVSEKGNLLSHTAILCREMGIPAIVGAKGIVGMLRSGDTIRMNGATGEINLISHD